MEKGKKKLIIRIVSTATVLVAAIAICTFVARVITPSVEANTKILQKVSEKYTDGSNFKILEIVPEHTNHENEEIGYFISDTQRKQDFMDVSRAKSIGSFFDTEGISNLIMMRDYGLIKDYGVDYGNRSGYVSDNPVYSEKATFASYPMTDYEAVDKQLVFGVYSMDTGLAGDYKIADGYFIDESGTINVIHGKTVSDNTVSSNEVGGAYLTRTLSVIANTDAVTEEAPQTETPVINNQDEVTVTVEDEDEKESDDGNTTETPAEEVPVSPEGSDNAGKKPDQGNMLQDIEAGVNTNPTENTYGGGYYQWAGATEASYEPVEEGDRSDKKLPEGITYVGDGTGNVRFVESAAGKYFGYAEKDLYYCKDENNYFYNGEWFKELVFGDKDIGINIYLETKTPSEITTLKGYDLIYISGRNETYISKGVDLSDSQVMELYNAVISNNHQAVIMDYALIDTTTVADKAAVGTLSNLEKLSLLLWQENQTAIIDDTVSENGLTSTKPNNGFDVSVSTGGDMSILSYGDVDTSVWYYLTTTGALSGYGNFVAGSVYVYEHRLEFFNSPKAQIDAYDFFGNGDFNSQYVDTVVAAGLSKVEYTVKVNNSNYPTEKMRDQITPAVVVQYILSYDGTASSLVKNELRVLEIQPCRDFSYNTAWGSETYTEIENGSNANKNTVLKNRREFIEKYLGEPFYKDGAVDMINIDYVNFTSMTVEEFICINDNINEEYDIIYIGSNSSKNKSYQTYGRNTGNFKKTNNAMATNDNDLPKEITDFKDNAMDGMVYYNIGDKTQVSKQSSQGSHAKYSLWGSIKGDNGSFRFAGRDLTKYKKIELLDYLDTGYPVIVAGDMLKTNDKTGTKVINPTKCVGHQTDHGYDHGRIDNCSVMYEFFQVASGLSGDIEEIGSYSASGYDNFISEADVESGVVDKELVIAAVNMPKLSMNITSRPTDYEYTLDTSGAITGQTALEAEADGKYYMNFEFTIQNISVAGTETDIYNPHLYIDVNADGKFSETEELEGAVVTNALTGVEVAYTPTINGNAYSLTSNVLYRLRREVPEGYQGSLPWCLKVAQYTNPKVSVSETGYSAIKGTEAVPIKILQIMNESGHNLNLQTSISAGTNAYGKYINQLKNLNMFDLQVTSVDMNTYKRNNSYKRREEIKDTAGNVIGYRDVYTSYYEHLDDFDMLVLGFSDNYVDVGDQDVNSPKLKAITDFIKSGKPVLLSHDFMAHYPNYAVVKQMRDMVGMDRYGVTDLTNLPEVSEGTAYSRTDPADIDAIEKIENSGRRVAYQPGSDKKVLLKETQGFTSYIQVRYMSGDRTYKYIYSPDMENWAYNANQDYVMFVNKVNDGQITNYPYKLPESFAVNKTHGQYFQLNMEGDQDEDGSPDVTVWYTLAYGHSNPGNPDSDTTTSKYSDGVYNVAPKDGVNHFYIYNCGNVTYTGSGHSGMTSPWNTYEAQLFINTMVAAYKAGIKTPTVSIYDGSDLNSSLISEITIPYDENIGVNATDTNKAESSIIKDTNGNYKYPFVNMTDANATKVFFRVADPNLVKGSKSIDVRFLQEVSDPAGTPGTETITLDNGEIVVVKELKMPFYSADFINTYAYGTSVGSGVMYGLKLPMNLLTSTSNFKIYIEAQTTITSISVTGDQTVTQSGKTYSELGVTKMDLLKLD